MREIEIKARLDDKSKFLQAITDNGLTVTSPVTQRDKVYGLPGISGGSENSEPWLRIREETSDGKVTNYFTLKKSVTNQLDSIEYELTVGDTDELDKLILALNFVPYSDLTKIRQKVHLSDTIEICIDNVAPLGDFVEAEMLCADDADYEAVVAELWQTLAPFNVDKAQQVTDGYDVLMNKHLGRE